ncbi:MAG TPA: hypothetical protein VM146_16740 [Steroidobacteraceae bacterium]|nr:hypothetical protein [Steroidobacteraceae bacterium]
MSALARGAWAATLLSISCGGACPCAGAAASAATVQPAAPGPPALAFRIDEGQNINSFVREGQVAAHLLLRSGGDPRILVAFPAGNSAVGLWFAHADAALTWTLVSPPRPVAMRDTQRRDLRGIEFEVEVSAQELRFRGAVLSSIRVLRDYELLAKAPPEVHVEPRINGPTITWARDRLDGKAGYWLSVEAMNGAVDTARIRTDASAMRLRVRALTGEMPLTPLPSQLTGRASDDQRARDALAFLSYQEKFLAGSWRFDTYFGRDTLISALLLAPVLEPPAMESAISSVLDRLAPNGEVAHEEDIGEFAVLRNAKEGRGKSDTPIFDYGMVDDDFLLAPLAARWLLDERGRTRAKAFLSSRGVSTRRRGELLVRNLTWVVERTRAFALDPRFGNLVGIKPGRMTGNWRDSEHGLGRGRYAFDINAALVPSALAAAARLQASGVLDDYLDETQHRALRDAKDAAATWEQRAPGLFVTTIPADRARAAITAYSREIGVGAAVAATIGDAPLSFHALSLDESGRPVPILNSDEGFRLLLTEPPPEELAQTLTSLLRPFPAGLLTEAGLLVANPALAEPALRREFTRFAYHGTVVWSWQQALLAAGLDRQLRRADLGAGLRSQLERARSDLWAAIASTRSLRTSELWSWSFAAGRYRAEPFGRPGADADESNAAQLWSTVYLGLAPPGVGPR